MDHRPPAAGAGTRRPFGRSRPLGLALALLLAVGLLAPGGAWALRQVDTPIPPGADDPSPAEGDAQVIAQGVAALPADQVAWRVVRDTAEPIDVAIPEQRALGFALADADPILVNDTSYGAQTRLAPGEAGFAPDGTFQQRTSLTEASVPYYRLALAPADQASDDGGDQLLFAGDGFAAPAGLRDLDLTGDVLAPGEEGDLADGGAPALVLVTAGEVEVEAAGSDPVTLAAGEAATFAGDLIFAAPDDAGEDAAYVVATVGPEVPPAPRFTGSVTVEVRACPEGMTAENLVAAECAAVAAADGFGVGLLDANGDDLTTNDDLGDGGLTWPGIPFGDYTVAEPEQPEGYDAFATTDAAGNLLDPATVSIGRAAPDATVVLFNFRAEAETGSVSLQVRTCPPGATEDDFDPNACETAEPGTFDVTGGGPTGRQNADLVLTLNGSAYDAETGTYTWDGLLVTPADAGADDFGPGLYFLAVNSLPAGYDTFAVEGADEDPDTGSISVRLTAEVPDATVTVYAFLSAATGGGTPTAEAPEDAPATAEGAGEETPAAEIPEDATATAAAPDAESPATATPAAETPAAEEPAAEEPAAGTGSVTITVLLCPEGTTPGDYDPSACAPAEQGGFGLTLRDTATQEEYTIADADGFGAEYTWEGLPFSDSLLLDPRLPEGFASYEATGDVTGGESVLVALNADNPDASLQLYFFPGE